MTKWTVLISTSTAVSKLENVLEYELLNLQAGVYHKFLFENNEVLYVNDFGIRSVQVMPAGARPETRY